MVPAVGRETTADHDKLLKSPFPPAPSQPLAQRKDVTDPGSDTTLCVPPPFWNVTVSPALIVRLRGEKVMPLPDTTWFAAGAAADSSSPETAIDVIAIAFVFERMWHLA